MGDPELDSVKFSALWLEGYCSAEFDTSPVSLSCWMLGLMGGVPL